MNKGLTGVIPMVAVVIGFLLIYSQTRCRPVKVASTQLCCGGYGAAAPAPAPAWADTAPPRPQRHRPGAARAPPRRRRRPQLPAAISSPGTSSSGPRFRRLRLPGSSGTEHQLPAAAYPLRRLRLRLPAAMDPRHGGSGPGLRRLGSPAPATAAPASGGCGSPAPAAPAPGCPAVRKVAREVNTPKQARSQLDRGGETIERDLDRGRRQEGHENTVYFLHRISSPLKPQSGSSSTSKSSRAAP